MDFNFVDDETQEDDDEFLDLSDLYDEEDEDEDEELEVAGYAITFEEDLPEAQSITDPSVRAKALKTRRRKSKASSPDSMYIGVRNAPSLHGLCKEGVSSDAKTKLPAHHEVCQLYEEWHVRANHLCSCDCHNYEETRKELENGEDASKTTSKSRGQRVRPEPESLSGSDNEEFILLID